MKFAYLLIIFPLLNALQLRAQASLTTHQHAQVRTIIGVDHPEQIPDQTAFRLWLVMVSRPSNLSTQDAKVQDSQLNKLGLDSDDNKSVKAILVRFYLDYHDLISSYNESAEQALLNHEKPDLDSFLIHRDQLVQSARNSFKTRLSKAGAARVEAYVVLEKRNMRISTTEVQR